MKQQKQKISHEDAVRLQRSAAYFTWTDEEAIRFHHYHRTLAMPIEFLRDALVRSLGHRIDSAWGGWFDDAMAEWQRKNGKPDEAEVLEWTAQQLQQITAHPDFPGEEGAI